MPKITKENILDLKKNEVFVFGSNSQGFHAAGAAGIAYAGLCGNSQNKANPDWIQREWSLPKGHESRIGNWAILGNSIGFQKGKIGCSYAVVTIVKPGLLRSVSLGSIYHQLFTLMDFASWNPEKEFLVTKIGCGYAGYELSEIAQLFNKLPRIPENIHLPIEFIKLD